MKKTVKFPLTSDQMQLLVAFEQCGSLSKLAQLLAKDPSVISRNLQRLAEAAPVIIKTDGRWQIAPLGREISKRALVFHDELHALLKIQHDGSPHKEILSANTAFLVINAQKGLSFGTSSGRSNPKAEENVLKLLKAFRGANRLIVHIRHVSPHIGSVFHTESRGIEFIDGLGPIGNEVIVDKHKSSGFVDTSLLNMLTTKAVETIVIAGFTANDCLDATARQAGDLGFESIVVGDATATFDLQGPDGKLHLAERVHALTLANLNAHVAKVITTADVLELLTAR
jgi:nicotinamidase-related amidase